MNRVLLIGPLRTGVSPRTHSEETFRESEAP